MSANKKELKETFATVISKDLQEGELDPEFARKYANDLQPLLKFYDCIKQVEHSVLYNMNIERPRLIKGWQKLWYFYNLSEEHHPVIVSYYGGNQFGIIPKVYAKLYMSEIPEWHTLYGIHDDSIQFDIVIPPLNVNEVRVKMNLKFMESIWKYGHVQVKVIGPTGKVINCNIEEVEDEKYFIYFDKSWKKLVKENGYDAGDIIRLSPEGLKSSNCVRVEKILREECMLGDETDLEICPSLRYMFESDSE